jgi:AcrR family transcriptional regulator
VAREAEVSEQTVYNYFQTKEQLVTDRDQLVQDELSRLIRTRSAAQPRSSFYTGRSGNALPSTATFGKYLRCCRRPSTLPALPAAVNVLGPFRRRHAELICVGCPKYCQSQARRW